MLFGGYLLLLVLGLRPLLTEAGMDGNELRFLLCRAYLKDCGESLAVFERHLLVELFARFQQPDFLW